MLTHLENLLETMKLSEQVSCRLDYKQGQLSSKKD